MMLAGVVLAGLLAGCKEDAPPSLWDPGLVSGPQPQITSIDPPGEGLAGVTVLTINGANFSPVKENNLVFFDDVLVPVLQASATQLQLKAPNEVGDTIKIKIAVKGADKFNDPPATYRLVAAVATAPGLGPSDEPWGTTVDSDGNVYVSIEQGGVTKVAPAPNDTGSSFAPAGGFAHWNCLRVGTDGKIYSSGNLAAIFEIRPNASPVPFVGPASGIGRVYTFDVDDQGNFWAGGNNPAIYRVTPGKNVKSFPFQGNVRSVRVYNGYLYIAGTIDSVQKVVRKPLISADSLGATEEYFNLTSSTFGVTGKSIFVVDFTSGGDMFVGTDLDDPLLIVHPNKTAEAFYAGILTPAIHILAWGRGSTLFAVQANAAAGVINKGVRLLSVNTQTTGAP